MNAAGQHMLKKACVPDENNMVGFVIGVNSNCQEKVDKAQEMYDNGVSYLEKKEGNGFKGTYIVILIIIYIDIFDSLINFRFRERFQREKNKNT